MSVTVNIHCTVVRYLVYLENAIHNFVVLVNSVVIWLKISSITEYQI